MNNRVLTTMIELMIALRDIEEKFKEYDDNLNYEVKDKQFQC